jgi:hypothetical protein
MSYFPNQVYLSFNTHSYHQQDINRNFMGNGLFPLMHQCVASDYVNVSSSVIFWELCFHIARAVTSALRVGKQVQGVSVLINKRNI